MAFRSAHSAPWHALAVASGADLECDRSNRSHQQGAWPAGFHQCGCHRSRVARFYGQRLDPTRRAAAAATSRPLPAPASTPRSCCMSGRWPNGRAPVRYSDRPAPGTRHCSAARAGSRRGTRRRKARNRAAQAPANRICKLGRDGRRGGQPECLCRPTLLRRTPGCCTPRCPARSGRTGVP